MTPGLSLLETIRALDAPYVVWLTVAERDRVLEQASSSGYGLRYLSWKPEGLRSDNNGALIHVDKRPVFVTEEEIDAAVASLTTGVLT